MSNFAFKAGYRAEEWDTDVYNSVEDSLISVELIKCYKGHLHINIQDKATSAIAITHNVSLW